MFKRVVYCVFWLALGALSLACSATKEWDPKSIDQAMASLEKEEKFGEINYGPSLQGEAASAAAFAEMADDYGLSGVEASSIMAVDLNYDGYTDLVFIQDFFSQPLFYLFRPDKNVFEKIPSLFDDTLKSSFLLFYDMDGDGVLDAVAGVLNQGAEVSERPLRLYKGYLATDEAGGNIVRFKVESEAFSLEALPTAVAIPLDYDLDGDLDLFVGNWFTKTAKGNLPEKDYLLENQSGKFSDVSGLLEGEADTTPDQAMYTNAIPTFSAQACDIDLNGFPDILVGATNGYHNKLWMSRHRPRSNGRTFVDYGVASSFAGDPDGILNVRGGGRTFSAACADYNNDGIMDTFLGELSHNHDADSIDRSSILTGSTRKFPPKFIRTEYVLDAEDVRWSQADKRAVWFDFNNDGLLDLWVDNSGYPPHTRALLFQQMPDHSFVNVAKSAGVDFVNPQSTVILDVNKDGRMDILSAQTDLRDARIPKRLFLFVNQSGEDNRSVRFFLRGQKSNRQGVGATVELRVQTPDGVERRTQHASYSYGSLPPQNEEGIHFGLAAGEKPMSVKVVWPFAKSANAGRAGLEKFYQLKDEQITRGAEFTLCEIGLVKRGRTRCPVMD